MAGLEVFGAVGTALSLIQMAKGKLGRARRVGRNLDDLRINLKVLSELQGDVDEFKDAELLGQIEGLANEAKELLEENMGTGPAAALRFLWTNSLDDDVERISRKVQAVYFLLDRKVQKRRERPPGAASLLRYGDDSATLAEYPPSTSPHTSPRLPAQTSPKLPARKSPPLPPQKHVRANSDTVFAEPRRTSSNRPPSFAPIPLPTTLYLYDLDNAPLSQPIRLEKFSILERDYVATSRVIQYESADQSVIVTHEIRFGTIPSTPDDLAACEVSFLESHIVTVENFVQTELGWEDIYSMYKLEPIYKFETAELCNKFMAHVRERRLLASFLPHQIFCKSIKSSGTRQSFFDRFLSSGSRDFMLSRWKVVRLWLRETNGGSLVTMTFHDRSKNPPQFTEWSLADFRDKALMLKRGRVVELARYKRDEQFMFEFQQPDEAERFKDAFERLRPG